MRAWNEGESKGISVSNSSHINSAADILRKNSDAVTGSYLIAVGSRSARFRRKRKEEIIIVVLLILILILIIIVITISIYYSLEKKKRVCESKQCVRSAANLLMSMDTTVDPCDDFYQYACGNWGEDHPKPDFTSSYDWFSDKENKVIGQIRSILASNYSDDEPLPLTQAKEMYAACIDTDTMDKLGMKPILSFTKNISLPSFPTILNLTKGFNYSNYEFDWLETIINVKKKTSFDVLIGFEIYSDSKNATLKRLIFGQPSASDIFPGYRSQNKILQKSKQDPYGNPRASFRSLDSNADDDEDDEDDDELYLLIYKEMMKSFLKDIIEGSSDKLDKTIAKDKIDERIDAVLDEYVKIYKLIYATPNITTEVDDDEDGIVYYTVKDLQNRTDQYLKNLNLSTVEIWKPYLLEMFKNTSVKIDLEKDLIMTTEIDIESMMSIVSIVQNLTCAKLEMYIWFQVIENFIPHTTTTIRELYDKYVMKVVGIEHRSPRSIYCSNTVMNMMGMAVSYAFVQKHSPDATISKVEKMLKNIKTSFEHLIYSVSWMDLPTKVATIEKVRKMRSLIGFPKWLFEPGVIEKEYKGVISHPEKHVENLLFYNELAFFQKIDSFRNSSVFDWETVPMEVNAYHTFQANAITIPLVMLQYPFFDLGHEALNYGSLGTILGHELTHGFDNFGRRYDKDGILTQWWSNQTINLYENKTKCLVKQYSDFYVAEVDSHVDGNLTLGENIADNGGLQSALKAFWMENHHDRSLPGLTHLNNEQLFFLSYGNLWCGVQTPTSLKYNLKDEHSPNYLRLKGTLQNMPEFARTWKCRKNSTMNPSDRRCIMF